MSIASYILHLLSRGTETGFQPEPPTPDNSMQTRLALGVGLIALFMPVILGVAAGLSPEVCFRSSLSHFYYDQFLGTVFVGMLVFIGGFLFAYKGETLFENVLTHLTGAAACGIAFFPVSQSGCSGAGMTSRGFIDMDPAASDTIFTLFPGVSPVHHVAAGIMFAFLAYHCIRVLCRVVPAQHLDGERSMLPTKRRRNILYKSCGLVIILCIASMVTVTLVGRYFGDDAGLRLSDYNVIFFIESLALWAFGIAWLTKGRVRIPYIHSLLQERPR